MEKTPLKISWSGKFSHLAGVDEAGRGPLAGPVAVGRWSVPPCAWAGLWACLGQFR